MSLLATEDVTSPECFCSRHLLIKIFLFIIFNEYFSGITHSYFFLLIIFFEIHGMKINLLVTVLHNLQDLLQSSLIRLLNGHDEVLNLLF